MKKMEISPEIIRKLSTESGKLWMAVHNDGSDNRINGDVILEASGYGAGFGLFAAITQSIRKKFRNRGKTQEDFDAEKEAKRINNTCGALEQMLLDYFRAAQEGSVGKDALDELIDTLEEMEGYNRSGKLKVPGEKLLTDIRQTITGYTADLAAESGRPVQAAEKPDADDFSRIREQLIRQRELLPFFT